LIRLASWEKFKLSMFEPFSSLIFELEILRF